MEYSLKRSDAFFAFMRKRHQIYLDRQAGKPWPWTDDPILQRYSFTNVFRELDKTTVWFKNNIRDRLANTPEVLLATVVFRWFNRPTTGSAIFLQGYLDDGRSAWEKFLDDGDTSIIKDAVLAYCGKGPYVSGAYIILGQQGMPKLDGVLACVQTFNDLGRIRAGYHWREVAERCQQGQESLESVWNWLRTYPYLGDFMSYEIVTDLRHTGLLNNAPDIMTWANPGPGAARGLARITERGVGNSRQLLKPVNKALMIDEMRTLLGLSQMDAKLWPLHWQKLEMREIEHSLCEFDKYERTVSGQGKPKASYRYRGL